MDEDFYFEESNPKKVFFICIIILFIIGFIFGAYRFLDKRDNIKLKEIIVELGDKVPLEISTYIKSGKYDGYSLDISSVHVDESGNTDSVGEYSFKITKDNITKKGKILVKDTKSPEVEVQELTVGLNEDFDVNDFILSCKDLSEICFVSYANTKEEELVKSEGTYDIKLKIKDKYNNEIIKKTKLIVSKDASLNNLKASNKEVTAIYPLDNNWNKTYTIKFSKGISPDDEEYETRILELSNRDFQEDYEEKIQEQTLLTIYNKYNYIIGFSIKLEFEDGNIIYVVS